MKKIAKIFGLLALVMFVFTSCSKDDDPADNDLFIGTYKGSVSYVSDGETKSSNDGSVLVTKVGSKYNFIFSNGIPNINGVEFKQDTDNMYINVGGDATSYIRINANTLKILYLSDGKMWTANCSR